jgi:uncharacterized membrane protein YphA (DoxX/SURF4 family)
MAQPFGKPAAAGGSSAQGRGLAVIRIMLGVFLVFEAMGKIGWLGDSGELTRRLTAWSQDATPTAQWYLQRVAQPGVVYFARLVPLGEFTAGLALILGFWTRLAAFLAFLMVLNFHVASSAIFRYSFLTNGYGLPVLSGLLGLTIGGTRLPWSVGRN